MLTAVRSDWGHVSTAPTGVFAQSMERMRAPISPPPASMCAIACGSPSTE
jgi:hypothetical protein